jgi:hypothetical protein
VVHLHQLTVGLPMHAVVWAGSSRDTRPPDGTGSAPQGLSKAGSAFLITDAITVCFGVAALWLGAG